MPFPEGHLARPSSPAPFFCRRISALDKAFSRLVEAVSDAGKLEEECRLLEDETDEIVSLQGGTTQLQVQEERGVVDRPIM